MTMETCSETVKWHKRYGHLNLRSLKNLADKEMVQGLPKIVMDIMWPISQSHFHVSYLCSLK